MHNRRQLANQRSKRRYQKPDGRKNKKLLNGKRSKFGNNSGNAAPCGFDTPPSPPGPSVLPETPAVSPSVNCSGTESTAAVSEPAADEVLAPAAPTENLTLPLDGFVLDESTLVNSPILPYVQMVASLLERRTISREELIAALRKSMRQRSIDRLPRREYVLRYLNQHPP
jgi:hypothetical protein